VKAVKCEIQKPSTDSAILFRWKFWSCFPSFYLARDQLVAQQTICRGMNKLKSKAGVNFEQNIMALLLVLHQTHNLSRNKFAHVKGEFLRPW